MTINISLDAQSHDCSRLLTATMLFSDLSESTRIAGAMDAEDYADLLCQLQEVYRHIIARHDGQIAQISGDGLLAAFGHPAPREDDTRRAIEAALDLRDAVRALSEVERWRSTAPRVHTGIHAGRVLLVSGDDVRGRFELLGRPTNIASRLCDHAGPDQILISERTLGRQRRLFETNAAFQLCVKGKDKPIATLAVIGRAATKADVPSTSFVGRGRELQSLFSKLEKAKSGASIFVEIRGAPGEGKTRLAEEFLRQAIAKGHILHRAECSATAEPLHPFLEIARSIFEIHVGLPGNDMVGRVRCGLEKIDAALLRSMDLWLRLLALGGAEGGTIRSAAVTSAFAALFGALTARGPVIVFLDDWHAADDASRALIGTLSHISGLYLLLTARADEAVAADMGDREVLRLPGFTEEETARLVMRFLPEPDPFTVAEIRHSSGGKPLFIEELCHAISSGETDLARVDGTVCIDGLIQSRLTRLPPQLADMVRAASVIGDVIPLWLFEMICGCRRGDPQLAQLGQADFIFSDEEDGTLRFKHGLTREIVYAGLGREARIAMHVRVAGALRQRVALRGEVEPVESLAYHCSHGREWIPAADYAERAGDKALESGAVDRAQMHYRQALRALDHMPRSPDNGWRWIRIAERFGRAGVFDPAREQLAICERAVCEARAVQDPAALAKAHFWLGYIYYGLGEAVAAIPHCEYALMAADTARDDRLRTQIVAALGQARAAACDYPAALALLAEAIEVERCRRSSRHAPIGLAYSLSCMAFALGDMGRFVEAHVCFDEAEAALCGFGHPGEVSVVNQRAVVCLWEGKNEDALLHAGRGMQIAERVGSYYSHAMSRSISAYARWRRARDPLAVQTVAEATAWLEARQRGQFTSLNYGWLAEMTVAQGRLQEGLHYATRALKRAGKQDRLGEVAALRALAHRAARVPGARKPSVFLDRAMVAARLRSSPHEEAENRRCAAELRQRPALRAPIPLPLS